MQTPQDRFEEGVALFGLGLAEEVFRASERLLRTGCCFDAEKEAACKVMRKRIIAEVFAAANWLMESQSD